MGFIVIFILRIIRKENFGGLEGKLLYLQFIFNIKVEYSGILARLTKAKVLKKPILVFVSKNYKHHINLGIEMVSNRYTLYVLKKFNTFWLQKIVNRPYY